MRAAAASPAAAAAAQASNAALYPWDGVSQVCLFLIFFAVCVYFFVFVSQVCVQNTNYGILNFCF